MDKKMKGNRNKEMKGENGGNGIRKDRNRKC